MSIYFSERAARHSLGYEELEPVSPGIEVGNFKLNLNGLIAPRTRAQALLKAAADSGRKWAVPQEAKMNDLVDIALETVTYGAVRTEVVNGSMKPFTTFLLHGDQKVRGVAPAIAVMGVGSIDNYSNFAGEVGPTGEGWYLSSPEGLFEVYRSLGILGIADRYREFSMVESNVMTETPPGHQVDLFHDLFDALNHNRMEGNWDIDDKRLVAKNVRLIGHVEDSRATEMSGAELLVRPILMEFLD